jgi:hypothetical protein
LFEVLAAVALMGLVYSLLAQAAIQGIRAEGENQRRLEASLLADELITDIEDMIASGDAPPIGRSEEEVDDFQVALIVDELDLESVLTLSGDDPIRERSAFFDTGEAPSRLRTVKIEVSWRETAYERVIRRTTYAFDLAGLEALLGTGEGGEIPEGSEAAAAAAGAGTAARRLDGMNKAQRARYRLKVSGKLDAWWKRRGGKFQ